MNTANKTTKASPELDAALDLSGSPTDTVPGVCTLAEWVLTEQPTTYQPTTRR